MNDNDNNRGRVIKLTDRAPMRIQDDDWPSIADAQWSDRGSRRSAWLRAREHHEHRQRVVYGQSDRKAAGELVGPDGDLEAAIRRVGERIEAPEVLIADCIASVVATQAAYVFD